MLTLVVVATLAISIDQSDREHQRGSATVLSGLVLSTLTAPTADAAVTRSTEYAADQYAAHAGYSEGLAQAQRDFQITDTARTRLLRRTGVQPGH